GKAYMVKDDVVAMRMEGLDACGDGGFINFVDAVGGYLRDEHLGDKGQTLGKGCIHPGDDQQKQEQYHEVDLTREDQAGACQDGGCHPETHDNAGSVDEQAGCQFAFDGDLLVLVDLPIEAGQIPFLLICGSNLPNVF